MRNKGKKQSPTNIKESFKIEYIKNPRCSQDPIHYAKNTNSIDNEFLAEIYKFSAHTLKKDQVELKRRYEKAIYRYSMKAMTGKHLRPSHLRSCIEETAHLKNLLMAGDMKNSVNYTRSTERVTNRVFFPQFQALELIVKFNTDDEFFKNFSMTFPIKFNLQESFESKKEQEIIRLIYSALASNARWRDARDTIASEITSRHDAENIDKFIRAGFVGTLNFGTGLIWDDNGSCRPLPKGLKVFSNMISKAAKLSLSKIECGEKSLSYYGFKNLVLGKSNFIPRINLNEYLRGPVLGPHMHYGIYHPHLLYFPYLSGVYYPFDIPDFGDDSGFLEFGRPDFKIPFEPRTFISKPMAGHIFYFPTFAFHQILEKHPKYQDPRISCNIDFDQYNEEFQPMINS